MTQPSPMPAERAESAREYFSRDWEDLNTYDSAMHGVRLLAAYDALSGDLERVTQERDKLRDTGRKVSDALNERNIEKANSEARVQTLEVRVKELVDIMREARPHVRDEYQRDWPAENDDAFAMMLKRYDAALDTTRDQGGSK